MTHDSLSSLLLHFPFFHTFSFIIFMALPYSVLGSPGVGHICLDLILALPVGGSDGIIIVPIVQGRKLSLRRTAIPFFPGEMVFK